MPTFTNNLLASAKNYGQCAKAVTKSIVTAGQPTHLQSDQLIGFGIASDWNKRASSMRRVTYNRQKGPRNKSRRGAGITELLRFNLAWYAINAIFARKAILDLLGTASGDTELERFRLVYDRAGIPAAEEKSLLLALHSTLSSPITTRIPGHPAGTPVTVLEAIFRKYIPADFQKKKVGKLLQAAIGSGDYSALDIPTLIYLMRNWTVHGAMMDGAFGGHARFESYIDVLLQALAFVHLGASKFFLARL